MDTVHNYDPKLLQPKTVALWRQIDSQKPEGGMRGNGKELYEELLRAGHSAHSPKPGTTSSLIWVPYYYANLTSRAV